MVGRPRARVGTKEACGGGDGVVVDRPTPTTMDRWRRGSSSPSLALVGNPTPRRGPCMAAMPSMHASLSLSLSSS